MGQGGGRTCNLSLLGLAALLTKEFLLTQCVPWLSTSWEKAGLVEDYRCQIHPLTDHLHLHVSANAIPLLENPPSLLTTTHLPFSSKSTLKLCLSIGCLLTVLPLQASSC